MCPVANALDLRGSDRRRVAVKVQLRAAGAGRFDVDLVDLSSTGFRCETFYGLGPGTRVFLTLPGLESLEAMIMWRRDFTYGGRFARPLYGPVFEAMAARFTR